MEKVFYSKEEELELGRKVQAMVEVKNTLDGATPSLAENKVIREGEKAVDSLARAYARLVYKLANSAYARLRGVYELEDIEADGMEGLVKAIYKYDPSRETKFYSVAEAWITQAINRGVSNNARVIRIPENNISVITAYSRVARESQVELSGSEIESLTSASAGVPLMTVRLVVSALSPASLDASVGDAGGSIGDFIASSSSVEASVLARERSAMVEQALADLTPFELAIVRVVSSPAGSFMTMADVGRDFGKSRQTVSKYKKELLAKLARRLESYEVFSD